MIPTSLTTVGICCEHACDQCGAAAATIEESAGGGFALMCARCGTSHGELPETTITRRRRHTHDKPREDGICRGHWRS